MRFGRAWFDLQLEFARRVAQLGPIALDEALLDYTNLYVRFGLGRAFDPLDPVWQQYLAGVGPEEELGDWTWRFFREQPGEAAFPGLIARFGCFSYAVARDGTIRLHFHNLEPEGGSPLADEQAEQRRAELRALVRHVRADHPTAERIGGYSWLYNLARYRRLFPADYVASIAPGRVSYRNMPLWGQFLERGGSVRSDLADRFVTRLAGARTLEELEACFPFLPLRAEAGLACFDSAGQRNGRPGLPGAAAS